MSEGMEIATDARSLRNDLRTATDIWVRVKS